MEKETQKDIQKENTAARYNEKSRGRREASTAFLQSGWNGFLSVAVRGFYAPLGSTCHCPAIVSAID